MTAFGTKGVGVGVGVLVGGVGVSVSTTFVADGVGGTSGVASAGLQPTRQSTCIMSTTLMADLRTRGDIPMFMIFSPLA
jgi:hypothetical protein